MTSITKIIPVKVSMEEAWQKIADIGAIDKLVPMITTCKLDGDVRTCTLPDGQIIKEQIITVDEASRRVAYTVTDGPLPLEFYCASVQVITREDQTQIVWIVDVKPDAIAAPLSDMMDGAAQCITEALA